MNVGTYPGDKKNRNGGNNILVQTTKPKPTQYIHEKLFILKTTSLLKSIKLGLLKTSSGLTKEVIKAHVEKYIRTMIGHLHIIRQ